MRITQITIENFKGIRDPATVELRPVTLLFGANSAGKSTIVHALHYMHELLEPHNVDPGRTLAGGEAVELGGFESLVHGQNRRHQIRLRLALSIDSSEELPTYRLPYVTTHYGMDAWHYQELQSAWVELHVVWSEILERPFLARYAVGWNGALFAEIEASSDLRNIVVSRLALMHPAFVSLESVDEPRMDLLHRAAGVLRDDLLDAETGSARQLGLLGQVDAMPAWSRPLDIQEQALAERYDWSMEPEFIETISQLIVGPGELARDALRSLRYVGPLRQVPPRNFEPVRSPDESRWATGLGAWDTLAKGDESLVERLNAWLNRSDRLDTGYRVRVKRYKELELDSPLMLALRLRRALDEDDSVFDALEAAPVKTRILLRDETAGLDVLPQDVGVGLSQLIPVLVAALDKPGIVAIEQPELHIHARWQVVLGDLFLSEGDPNLRTFIIETHSEHLVLRIMRRMRETFAKTLPPGAPTATPEHVAVYVVEVNQQQTIVREMPLNEAGEFVKAWPGGFFEEGLREQFGDA